MYGTIVTLVSIGRIISDLGNSYYLDSATPKSLLQSTLVLSDATPDHSQHFYAGFGSNPDQFFLATYDLKYVLHVTNRYSPRGNRLVEYANATEPIVHNGPYPSFITSTMLFTKEISCSADVFRFKSLGLSIPTYLDVEANVDRPGTPIIAYPFNKEQRGNQCFDTQNPF